MKHKYKYGFKGKLAMLHLQQTFSAIRGKVLIVIWWEIVYTVICGLKTVGGTGFLPYPEIKRRDKER
ncbi:hypothetical protein MCJ35_11910 [Enterocloster sp. OA13]|uniref:Uncharacterized protein n=1 Tax=Enterocloster hominis (ex Hitch et al. 2024) TaxID=1917870 RepID=A0ABV1D738_9FIRM|nr:hypothetical protein [Lachnoclostridium pacaense]EEQ56745.1 hypothetical protein CBFG_00455 [Clostridiales bacterium 1_7_47FAA]MCD8168036.1 hypothetical protein [Clostridiales bacterium]MCH1949907.1 hypothetical protein [Enterocloster sp. OA13]RJW36857.1 hypothetical protein DXC92_22990 [Clostridiales bacterium TF09-2AC]MCC2816626.1 hypothetical protein [Lachnoclostridium pacaense]